jgi:O-antigen ligase
MSTKPGVMAASMRGGLRAEAPGSRVVLATRPQPDALLWVVLGIIMTAVWRWHDLVPAVRALRPAIALILLGVALFAASRHPARSLGRLRSPVVRWLAVVGALMVIGIPFSLDPDHSARVFANAIVPYALAGFLVALSVRTFDDVEWLALGALFGGCVYTAVVYVTAGADATGRWGPLPYYDANDVALLLVSMLPVALYFLRSGNPGGRRLFAAACFVFFSYAVVKTGSRGGLVGLVAVLGYLLITYRALSVRTRVAGVVAAVVLLAAGGQAFRSRASTILRPTEDYNWQDETGRLALWRRGLAYVRERPVLGLGLDSFRGAENTVSPVARRRRMAGRGAPYLVAHNMFIHVTAELGIPALIAFTMALAAAGRTLHRVRRHYERAWPDEGDRAALARSLMASLIGFCVCGMFLSVAYSPFLHVLFGLTIGLGALAPVSSSVPRQAGFMARGGYGLAGDAQSRSVL